MTLEQLRVLLEATSNEDFVDTHLLNRRPWIFDDDHTYSDWLTNVAAEIRVPKTDIKLVGSAATGYSLSPLKPARAFRRISLEDSRTSDIDIAVLNHDLFIRSWNVLINLDRNRSLRDETERSKIRLDIYHGVVSQKTLPRNTEPAQALLAATSVLGRKAPLRGYPIKCRVYRRLEDLKAYHVSSLRHLRTELNARTK